MEKEFIPYEQALALKELGFDEPCIAFYNGKFLDFKIQGGDICPPYLSTENRGECPNAPLYQQAFRWFREKHGLYHFIGLDVMNMSSLDDINKFAFKTAIFNSKMDGYDAGNYKSFEEAELACLKKLIQIV
jgi:hypothetical protein